MKSGLLHVDLGLLNNMDDTGAAVVTDERLANNIIRSDKAIYLNVKLAVGNQPDSYIGITSIMSRITLNVPDGSYVAYAGIGVDPLNIEMFVIILTINVDGKLVIKTNKVTSAS